MRASLSRQEVAANQGSSERSVGFVDYLFNPHGPKFLFDDLYHFSMRHYRRHANNRNMLPVVKLMTATVLERMASLPAPVLFVPEAITNGIPYLELAESHAERIRSARGGDLTTYRLGELFNKDELDSLTEKNKNRAMTRLEGFRRLYPYYSVMSPTGMEAMLKTLVKEAGFTNYQMLRDEDFEAFWIAVCLNSLRGGFADDVAGSRNGNFETFALFQVQYGVVPFRPRGDIDVVMPNKKIATPYDYVEMLFAHLLDVVPRGFTSDLAVKMAVRMLMLEEMRTKGLAHPEWGPLIPEKMNPNLRGLSASHDKAFVKLRRDLLTFMKDHKLERNLGDMYGLDGYDRLGEYYRAQAAGVTLASGPRSGGGGSGGGGAYVQESRAKLDMDAKLKKKELFNLLSVSIPYQLDGDFFSSVPDLLSDHEFSSLGQAEQIALKAFMGLSETVKPSQKLTQSGFILIDRRGGEAAKGYAENFGLVVPGEARGLKTSFGAQHFDEVVKQGNIEKAQLLKDQLLRVHYEMNVSSFEQVEHDADVFRYHRSAIAAPGSDRLSGPAKILYGNEIMRRSSDLAVFDRDWETSSLLVAMRCYARKIQLGLVDRPVNKPPHQLNVADIAPLNPGHTLPYTVCSLADDLAALTAYVRKLSTSGVEEYPRQPVRGLLETLVMTDLYYNKNLNLAASGAAGKPLIDWQAVPLSAKDGLESRKAEILALRHEAKELLIGKALLALAPDELTGQLELIDPDYSRAWKKLKAEQDEAKSRKARRSSQRDVKGFDAT